MRKFFLVTAILTVTSNPCFTQTPSDTEILAAIEHGKTTPAKKLWGEIKKKQQVTLNRAGFDPIEKKLLFLSDRDRIALETAEAEQQLREISVDYIRKNLPLGAMDILLEANCYNDLYAGSLLKWGPEGGVHVILRIGEKVIQPIPFADKPLYRSSAYVRASRRTWFTFEELPPGVSSFTVVAISGEGNQKEKRIRNLLN